MRLSKAVLITVGIAIGPVAAAEVAKHTTVTTDAGGRVTEYTEMVADDNGNLRIEMYGVDGSGNRGALRDFVVFQANEKKMVSSSRGRCDVMNLEGDELPGGITRDEMAAAQAEMQAALAEMREENPEMARMLEAQMGDRMAAMMGGQQPVQMQVVETGKEMSINGYDTTGFQMTGGPGGAGNSVVWAADIDDVEGGRLMSAATGNMMRAMKQMMENMGIDQMVGTGIYSEIMELMEDYYPIATEEDGKQTKLVSTDGQGSEDFYPVCN